MSNSVNLGLPFIEAAQSQKHVTHNEAIRRLDAVIQLAVIDRDLTTPPGSPSDGDRYLIAATASGNWSGKEDQIAAWLDGTWEFFAPQQGWLLWVNDEQSLLAWNGSAWVDALAAMGAISNLDYLGVNATADETNRLSVSSSAVLLNHEGAGHQLKINKNTAADTASLLFQTGFSGRAEMGLAGDDDYSFKVSADGSAWNDAIIIDRTTGEVSLPNTSIGGAGIAQISTQVFTTSGTWTKPSGLIAAKAIVVGGGGGAGGSPATSSGQHGNASGGGAGGTAVKMLAEAVLGTTEAITVGAGGSGGAAGGNAGSGGGNSSFGTHLSATGGAGGSWNGPTGTPTGWAGGAGGMGNGGDYNFHGGPGGSSFGSMHTSIGGNGGNSFLGGGARGAPHGETAVAGSNYGGGGGGASNLNSSGGKSGGDGADGVVIVIEYIA